jgi:type I restriction enzyme S subunit
VISADRCIYRNRLLGLNKLNSHSAVPGLNREAVYSIPVKLPPKAEQEQIALTLDTVQRGLEFENEAIKRSEELNPIPESLAGSGAPF